MITDCNILEPKSSRNSSLLWDILILVWMVQSSLLMALLNISRALSTFTGCFWYSMSSNWIYNFSFFWNQHSNSDRYLSNSNLSWGHYEGFWTARRPGPGQPEWYGQSSRRGLYHSGGPRTGPNAVYKLSSYSKLRFLLLLVHWTASQS